MADPVLIGRTRQHLKKHVGGRDRTYPFMELQTRDMVHWWDDFLGDTVRGDATSPGVYEIVTGVDGAINILADQATGVAELRASNGNGADNEYGGLSLPELAWTGSRNAVMAARIAIDAITTVKVEVGFTDVTTDAGAVNALATPTFTANDAVVWVFDVDDTSYWQCAGTQAGTPATKIEPTIAPTAGAFETLEVVLRGTNAKFLRYDTNGYKTYESAWMTSAVTAATALVPWVFVQLRTGTIDRNVQIDYLDVYQRRTTS